MIARFTSKTCLGSLMALLVLATAGPAVAMNDPVTGRWLTRDPAGYVDGANLYLFAGSNPVRISDPSGLFKIHLHKQYTSTGYCASGVEFKRMPNILDRVIGSNWMTDILYALDDSRHAQSQGFVSFLARKMRYIRTMECEDNCYGGLFGVDVILDDMGQALHAIQDFYSHTDWIEGSKMRSVYWNHGDSKYVSAIRHDGQYPRTFSLEKVAIGDGSELTRILVYPGGIEWGHSRHDAYSVDDIGLGRSRRPPYGQGTHAYYRAAYSADVATAEFFRWAYDNIRWSCHRLMFF